MSTTQAATVCVTVAPIPIRRSKVGKVYRPTPEIDAQITAIYQAKNRDSQAIKELAAKLHWNRWNVIHRAGELGVARAKEKPWSADEVAVLESYPWMSVGRMRTRLSQMGYTRSEVAINLKMKRLRIRASIEGYSMCQLAEAFGVDTKLVGKWVKSGWLDGRKRGTLRVEEQGGDMWYFSRENVYRFAMEHPSAYELRKVEQLWFLDLITKGKIGERVA